MTAETGRRLTMGASPTDEELGGLLQAALEGDDPNALVECVRVGERTTVDGRFNLGRVARRIADAVLAGA